MATGSADEGTSTEGAPEPTRRELLDLALVGAGVALAGAVGYPAAQYLVPPIAAAPAETSVVAARASEMKPGSGKNFRFGDKPALLVLTPSGEFRAYIALCPHLNCIVQFRADLGHIWCACHNGQFGLDGSVLSGPPPKPLEALEVVVRGDDVVVQRA
ncbi:MAG TPA: Rieske 2Fe-2S domain-containing protein [Myxococcota bacterium]|jgi:cytochrome b6-f complex iron-sulfur subunit|nr:Rieske 2Fe-2S domain-containing protein [Myxococcota bacterium]